MVPLVQFPNPNRSTLDWTGHGVMRAPAASSRFKEQCTVTVNLTTVVESVLTDRHGCLTEGTEPADGKPFLYSGERHPIRWFPSCAPRRATGRGNRHGGELLHEDDYYIIFSDSADACMLMTRLHLSFLCYTSLTSRPPGWQPMMSYVLSKNPMSPSISSQRARSITT